ncbi:MAG: hypothetical protein AAB583_00675 [Patescibacteria group bacterium]
MKKIHLLLTGLSVTILLLSLNRFTSFTLSYLQPYDFLRWLDFNAMIPIPLLSILLYYFLLREVTYESSFKKTKLYIFLFTLFTVGVYLFGASSGNHEVTNYLNTRFCERGTIDSPLCNIIAYNDDEFSHLIYYLGFVFMNVVLLLMEYNMPRKKGMVKKDYIFVSLNALFIGLGIFANLAFEEIGIDLYVFGFLMVLSLYLLYSKKVVSKFPITYYFAVSYTIGVVGTSIFKLISNLQV